MTFDCGYSGIWLQIGGDCASHLSPSQRSDFSQFSGQETHQSQQGHHGQRGQGQQQRHPHLPPVCSSNPRRCRQHDFGNQ